VELRVCNPARGPTCARVNRSSIQELLARRAAACRACAGEAVAGLRATLRNRPRHDPEGPVRRPVGPQPPKRLSERADSALTRFFAEKGGPTRFGIRIRGPKGKPGSPRVYQVFPRRSSRDTRRPSLETQNRYPSIRRPTSPGRCLDHLSCPGSPAGRGLSFSHEEQCHQSALALTPQMLATRIWQSLHGLRREPSSRVRTTRPPPVVLERPDRGRDPSCGTRSRLTSCRTRHREESGSCAKAFSRLPHHTVRPPRRTIRLTQSGATWQIGQTRCPSRVGRRNRIATPRPAATPGRVSTRQTACAP